MNSRCPMTRASIIMVIWVGLIVNGARAADAPKSESHVLLMFDAPRVLSLNLDRPDDKPVTLIERAGWFRAHPSGQFVRADRYYHTERGARWYVCHVKDPKALKEVGCPLRDGEVLRDVALSNDATRVVWATHQRGKDGRLLV